MMSKKICRRTIVPTLTKFGVFLGLSSGIALLPWRDYAHAQMPLAMTASGQPQPFRRLEQPLGLKMGVVAGGAALIGLELWWFLFSKKQLSKKQ